MVSDMQFFLSQKEYFYRRHERHICSKFGDYAESVILGVFKVGRMYKRTLPLLSVLLFLLLSNCTKRPGQLSSTLPDVPSTTNVAGDEPAIVNTPSGPVRSPVSIYSPAALPPPQMITYTGTSN